MLFVVDAQIEGGYIRFDGGVLHVQIKPWRHFIVPLGYLEHYVYRLYRLKSAVFYEYHIEEMYRENCSLRDSVERIGEREPILVDDSRGRLHRDL